MSERLPREIDPLRLADEGVRLQGELPGELFVRLREQSMTGGRPEPVSVNLQFERTGHGIRLLRGTIQTRFDAVCQRCLGPVSLTLVAKPFLALLAAGESPAGAPEDAETLVVEGSINLAELVEDELLLGMPMIPMHENGRCSAPGSRADEAPAEAGQDNPFASLRGMKTRK